MDWHAYFGTDLWSSVVLILSILLMETLLSLDNAAALSLIVKKLPEKQQGKALEYGLIGAFVMRFGSIFLVSVLARFWIIQVLGGLYLIWLAYGHFTATDDTLEEVLEQAGEDQSEDAEDPKASKIYNWIHRYISVFWSTVIVVELMDMVFSMDNIFAVTAMTKYFGLICIAVGLGIISMRVVAKKFIKLMKIMPWLENLAFGVIALLGVKLAMTFFEHVWFSDTAIMKALASEEANHIMSYICLTAFAVPILSSIFFNYPAKAKAPPITPIQKVVWEEMQAEFVDEPLSEKPTIDYMAPDPSREAKVVELTDVSPRIEPPGPESA